MPYLQDTTRRLGIKFDSVPPSAVGVVASFAELRFVDSKVRYFDPQGQPLNISDGAMHNLVDPVGGANKGRQLYELALHYPGATTLTVGLYYIVTVAEVDTEYLFWKVQLSPSDNFGMGQDGFYVLDGCGQLKTAVNTCSAGTGTFTQDIGDEESTDFALIHNFGTRDLVWSCRTNDSPYSFVDVDVKMTSPNVATVTGFPDPPDADEFRMVLMEGDFAQSFGDGVAMSFLIQHNLGTRDVLCAVWDAASPYQSASVDIAHTSLNEVTVSGFVSAPTTNQYRLVVKKAGLGVSGGYAQAYGDASATSFTITHNRNDRDVIPANYEAASPYAEIGVDVGAATVNAAAIGGFGSPPTLNQYRFVMQS